MHAIIYTEFGESNVLHLVEREVPLPQPNEVLVQLHLSGVNPTDWKSRSGSSGKPAFPEIVPNQDGAGVITAVGSAISPERVGERVWVYEAQHNRADGTAQEYIAINAKNAVELPESASFELGASLGVPAITAHRCLTIGESGPARLEAGSMSGQTILVAGGAGAVGHAAIELARWAGATVIATVSSDQKAQYARSAGAHHVVNYREDDAAEKIRSIEPGGVDLIVEVSSVTNLDLNTQILRPSGAIAIYASGSEPLSLEIRTMMRLNARLQFVYLYLVDDQAKAAAIADISDALDAEALHVGEDYGLPLVYFPLSKTAEAHQSVENHAVGKVLINTIEAH